MRADRLLSILMLLQGRRSMTAAALARELEVSVRTIYRDVSALSYAGVPIAADGGPGGGYALEPGYRSGLTGLTGSEVEALALVRVPAGAAALGSHDALRTALEKLLASADVVAREHGEATRQRVLIEPAEPRGEPEAGVAPVLHALRDATMSNTVVEIGYLIPFGLEVRHRVAPLGLVCHGGVWHIVYERAASVQWLPVASIVRVRPVAERFSRDPRFDLRRYWSTVESEQAAAKSAFTFRARIAPPTYRAAVRAFGGGVSSESTGASAAPELLPGDRVVYPPVRDWIVAEIRTGSIESARSGVLALGGGIEVLAPTALRDTVAAHARAAALLYRQPGDGGHCA